MRYVAGELLNWLEQARAITLSPAADADFPPSRLYDGYADAVCAFGSNASGPSVIVDLALLDKDRADNGNLDSWAGGAPSAWTAATSGTATVEQTSTAGEVRTGSAAKLNKGDSSAAIIKTYKVRAGQRLTVEGYMRKAAAGAAGAMIFNPVTKHYLTPAGGWDPALQAWAAETVATVHTLKTMSFTVESYADAQDPITYLQLILFDFGTGGAGDFSFFDDWFIWPHWNAVVIAGHNIEPGMAPELRSSTDAFGAVNTLEASLTLRQPSFHGYLAVPSTRRYARLALTGTQSAIAGAVWAAELAVTYLEQATVGPSNNWDLRFMADNIVSSAPGGKVMASRTVARRRRAIRMDFEQRTAPGTDEHRELRDEITTRCHGALWPLVVIPIDAEDTVIHGRLDDSWEARRVFATIWDADLLASDNPFPRVTPA